MHRCYMETVFTCFHPHFSETRIKPSIKFKTLLLYSYTIPQGCADWELTKAMRAFESYTFVLLLRWSSFQKKAWELGTIKIVLKVLQLQRIISPRKFMEGFNRVTRNEKFSVILKNIKWIAKESASVNPLSKELPTMVKCSRGWRRMSLH